MRALIFADYAVIGVYTLVCFIVGFYFTRKANESTDEYFLGGRSMPWWLLGTSMAATNFATDTPLAITKYIYQEGIAGVWFFWMSAIQVCLATFLFSQLWRRAEVVTDIEIVERRYSGKSAVALRIFKGAYFGVLVNTIVMGWVYKGLIKILTGVIDIDTTQVIVIFTAIVVIYTLAAGFHGVIWTDFIQYFIAVTGCFVLAYYSVKEVGGLESMVSQLNVKFGEGSGLLNIAPSWPQADQWMPMSVFLTYIGIQWWAHKYSDGGGKHIQRMSSAINEKHAVLGTFFFSFMNYVVQVWPWIITALCALLVFGRDLKDPEMAYPMMIAKVMPPGMLGLLIVMAIAAFMSTIATHTNLGSSYMVNDIYRRFIKKDATEKHYLVASKIATLVTLGLSIMVALNLQSIGSAWKLVVEFASGAGLTWVLRWFWWRVNAWTELSAMIVSGITTVLVETMGHDMLFSHKIWIIVSVSTAAWLIVTFATAPVDDEKLREFVAKVGPARLGWARVYKKYNLTTNFKLHTSLFNWFLGLLFLGFLNFGVGHVLLTETIRGIVELVVAAVLLVIILVRINQMVEKEPNLPRQDTPPPARV